MDGSISSRTDVAPRRRREKDRLDSAQQIVGLVPLDIEVGVARHAESVVGHDLHPGEHPVEVRGHELFDRQEALAVRQWEEPREERRHLQPREPPLGGYGIAHQYGEVQREARDVRERVRRIDRERRQDGEDPLDEGLGRPVAVVVGEVCRVDELDPDLVERRAEFVAEEVIDAVGASDHAAADHGELLVRAHPVGCRRREPGFALLEQPRDADLEELVEALRADREVLRARKDRPGGVLGERQDAVVEVEPRQFSVQVAGGRFVGRRDGVLSHGWMLLGRLSRSKLIRGVPSPCRSLHPFLTCSRSTIRTSP
jgi:hypothetical protein